MNKLIYWNHQLIDFYKRKNVTSEIRKDLFRTNIYSFLDQSISDKKVVFYPFAGYEFGTALKYMLKVHYHPSNHKIVCIPKGYECFFPDAKEFIYDYPGPQWQNFNPTQWPMWDFLKTEPENCRERKFFRWNSPAHLEIRKEFDDFVKEKYPDAYVKRFALSDMVDPFKRDRIKTFAKIPFAKTNNYKINVDVVIANRKGSLKNQIGLDDPRTFQKWPNVIKVLKMKGFTVGGIGTKGGSFQKLKIINNFDYDNPNVAAIEMLHNAKYYIGTDTGVTHLAMNFPHLKSLLFRCQDRSQDCISWYENENTKIIKEMSDDIKNFNKQTFVHKYVEEFFT